MQSACIGFVCYVHGIQLRLSRNGVCLGSYMNTNSASLLHVYKALHFLNDENRVMRSLMARSNGTKICQDSLSLLINDTSKNDNR